MTLFIILTVIVLAVVTILRVQARAEQKILEADQQTEYFSQILYEYCFVQARMAACIGREELSHHAAGFDDLRKELVDMYQASPGLQRLREYSVKLSEAVFVIITSAYIAKQLGIDVITVYNHWDELWEALLDNNPEPFEALTKNTAS